MRHLSLRVGVLAATLSLVALVTAPAYASPITYILTGIGSGSVSSDPFTNQSFTIFGQGDTASATTLSGFPAVPLTTMTIDVNAFATATPVLPFTVLSTTGGAAGFFSTSLAQAVSFSSASLSGWNAVTAFGPHAVNFNASSPITTDLGIVTITSFSSATFTAIVSAAGPEPSALALLLPGIVAVGIVRRRKS